MDEFNKNEKQLYFNQIKGELIEMHKNEKFAYILLNVGHEHKRIVYLNIKLAFYDDLLKDRKIGDKVAVRFYLKSTKIKDNWITKANVITVDVNKDAQIQNS